jgi:RNA polymerase sigma-54 factor
VRLLADGAVSSSPSSGWPRRPGRQRRSRTGGGRWRSSFEYQDNNPDNGVTGDADWSFDDVARSGKSPDDDDARPQLEAHELTLREHLLEQIRVTARTLRDRALLELLTDALDESGYLEEPLEDIPRACRKSWASTWKSCPFRSSCCRAWIPRGGCAQCR